MNNNYDLIVHKLPRELDSVNVYPLGDLHIGSPDFDMKVWKRWKEMVKNDDKGYVVIVGDLMDNGLKDSRTNIYEATMTPMQQKEWLADELFEIRDKILGACPGNHELRSKVAVGICPLYDTLAKISLEHLYRQDMGFLKINVGERTETRQCSYTMVLTHGSSKAKTEKFSYTVDGMDVFVVGHIHQAGSRFPAKVCIDSKNEAVTIKGYVHLTVPSFQTFGGYAMRALYQPQDSNKFPVIELSGLRKEVNVHWV